MDMGSSVLWSWIAALSCLLCMGEVRCGCTLEGMEITGGIYTLTQELETGSLLVYQCPAGYYPHPHLSRVCQGSTWKPEPKRFSPQRCKVVECPDPNVLEQGSVFPPQEKYFVDNETTYVCYSGYTLRGSARRVCLPNGRWSGSTPICSRDSTAGHVCADPGIPAGASRSGNIFTAGGTLKYSCGNNLILMGSSERVCQENGQWTGIEPACYYKHTYDTALEVAEAFGSGIGHSLALSGTPDGVLNFYIAVDISQSIDKAYVQNAIDTISRLIQKVGAFPVTTDYEIFFFSSEVVEVANILSPPVQNETILENLRNFQINSTNTYGTNLNLAFETILERMKLIKSKVGEEAFKKHHRHVLILFTDGGYNMGGTPVPTVEKIKNLVNSQAEHSEKPLDIYIFGIGAEIFDGDLQPLTAGLGGRRYFRIKDMGNLPETLDAAVDDSHI